MSLTHITSYFRIMLVTETSNAPHASLAEHDPVSGHPRSGSCETCSPEFQEILTLRFREIPSFLICAIDRNFRIP
jgi:hypothetical protein